MLQATLRRRGPDTRMGRQAWHSGLPKRARQVGGAATAIGVGPTVLAAVGVGVGLGIRGTAVCAGAQPNGRAYRSGPPCGRGQHHIFVYSCVGSGGAVRRVAQALHSPER